MNDSKRIVKCCEEKNRRRSVNAAFRRHSPGAARLRSASAPISTRIATRMRCRAVDLDGSKRLRQRQAPANASEGATATTEARGGGAERSGGGEAPSARSVSPIVVLVARNGHREHSLTRRKVRHIASRPILYDG